MAKVCVVIRYEFYSSRSFLRLLKVHKTDELRSVSLREVISKAFVQLHKSIGVAETKHQDLHLASHTLRSLRTTAPTIPRQHSAQVNLSFTTGLDFAIVSNNSPFRQYHGCLALNQTHTV